MLEGFAEGFTAVFTWYNMLAIALGVWVGIIIGAIPGLNATMGVAIFTPFTFYVSPLTGISFLLGIYKGSMYGGSISAILIRAPGTPAAAATVLDGFAMCQAGKALKALKTALYVDVLADMLGTIALIFGALWISKLALMFGPVEMFALVLFGLSVSALASQEAMLKGVVSTFGGLFLATIGHAPVSGVPRWTFSSVDLESGLGLVPMLVGLFAASSIFRLAVKQDRREMVVHRSPNPEDNRVTLSELWSQRTNFVRSWIIGTIIGAIPAVGSAVSCFVAYNEAKRASKNPEHFGKGAIEGVVAAEVGANSVIGGALITMMSLGIPGDAITAALIGAFMIHGITPGPLLFQRNVDLVYGLFSGLVISNFLLLLFGLITIYFFLGICKTRGAILYPVVLVISAVGAFSVSNNVFDVKVMVLSGVLGLLMEMLGFPLAPMVIGFVLGPLLEASLGQALALGLGNPLILIQSPIAIVFYGLVVFTLLRTIMKSRHLKGSFLREAQVDPDPR
jgi:putative tricarboxylic transport membrane protein